MCAGSCALEEVIAEFTRRLAFLASGNGDDFGDVGLMGLDEENGDAILRLRHCGRGRR